MHAGYLLKPYAPEALLAAIRAAIDELGDRGGQLAESACVVDALRVTVERRAG